MVKHKSVLLHNIFDSSGENRMRKITPFLWFEENAEEALNFYTSIFENSKITSISRYGADSPGTEGTLMTANIELDGNEFVILNGGPYAKFNPAISFLVHCQSQAEVDYFWGKLSEGGETSQCGWLHDKFGITWQIVPDILGDLLQDSDSTKVYNVTQAMLKMAKIEIDQLLQAYQLE